MSFANTETSSSIPLRSAMDERTVEIVQESLHASRTTPQFLIEDRCQPRSELHLGSDVEAFWNLDRINGPCSHPQFGTALYDLLELSLGQLVLHPALQEQEQEKRFRVEPAECWKAKCRLDDLVQVETSRLFCVLSRSVVLRIAIPQGVRYAVFVRRDYEGHLGDGQEEPHRFRECRRRYPAGIGRGHRPRPRPVASDSVVRLRATPRSLGGTRPSSVAQGRHRRHPR